MTYSMNAQTLSAIEKAIKDPKRTENEAKADVLLIDKKKIFDDSTFADKKNNAKLEGRKKEVKKKP